MDLNDPVSSFLEAASVPRNADHQSGTLEHADAILARFPDVAKTDVYTAAVLGDVQDLERFLSFNAGNATSKGGPYAWDALTYLCFSCYLKLDPSRATAFVECARLLLGSGASANTGWHQMMDHPVPHPIRESAIYGAAAIANHAELTQLLLHHGADPNDGETPYHVPENYDNTVLRVLLDSKTFNAQSLSWLLVRKADVHDTEGLRLVLRYRADPNLVTRWGINALHQAIRRDNELEAIQLLLEHGANPALKEQNHDRSAIAIAARRGRSDVLDLFESKGFVLPPGTLDALIADFSRGKQQTARPELLQQLLEIGGTLLAEFAGNGNIKGIRALLGAGVSITAVHDEGDPYFDIARQSTALHVAAWRARHAAVNELIQQGAPINALDGHGRSALSLAVKACVDSYWTSRRKPDSVAALLAAGATIIGVNYPCGYREVDELIRAYCGK